MSDLATLAVMRDVFAIAGLSLAIALTVYGVLRVTQDLHWNLEGNVLVRPYNTVDVCVALALLSLMVWGGMQRSEGGSPKVEELSDAASAAGLFFSAVILIFLSLMLVGYLTIYRGLNPAEMFGLRQMSMARAFGVSIGAVLLVVLSMGVILYIATSLGLGWKDVDNSPQDTVKIFKNSGNVMSKVLLGVLAVVVAPLSEEIFFRGFLYGVVKRFTDRWFAAIFSALVFAAVHQHVGSLVPLFLLAIGFALAYETTGCLLVPVFMHALFNAGNLVALSL
ncbi:type II CAAX endopeptidase family protein [Verrucomicrobium sp. BvORR034]|jgi:membrane protease YdiL (CAAX protease family)|uniref:CPBP family intramembrane glutamic endopeptidase n=1 Tax=Verrucomicrobium sp. BvORR034 TaxID=1396418 RepID=UPI0006784718|nr:type II CAAX endopeptidase family protein [Verrucomicrobium sp. BvORR034]